MAGSLSEYQSGQPQRLSLQILLISPGESAGEELEASFVRFRKGRKKKISLSEDVIILANFALVDDNIHKEHKIGRFEMLERL
jgi:hypothetical protein